MVKKYYSSQWIVTKSKKIPGFGKNIWIPVCHKHASGRFIFLRAEVVRRNSFHPGTFSPGLAI